LEKNIEFAPSILSADFSRLADEIRKVEDAGASLFHLDIMDGHFVPNITIGPPVVASVRRSTKARLDVHLMIENPERYVDEFIEAGADWISVHVETDVHLDRTLNFLRERGVLAGVALNPATPLHTLDEVLYLLDFVLIMTVNPGFGGQKFIPSSIRKVQRLAELRETGAFQGRIEVDGGIDPSTLPAILEAGADVIVAGSAIFGRSDPKGAYLGMKKIADRFAGSV
jgi:ribulose-phosphate 3-epimerase